MKRSRKSRAMRTSARIRTSNMEREQAGDGSRPLWPGSGALATINACGRAVERSPWLAREAVDQGHEISCHGWRWERHVGHERGG